MEKLLGQVAAVLNDRELVINLGSEAGVREGMIFKVLDAHIQIADPITKEMLGEVQREKIKVKAVEVKQRLTVARTFETYQVNTGGLGGMPPRLGPDFFGPPKWETRVRTLEFGDDGSLFQPADVKSAVVRVGDAVEQFEDLTAEPPVLAAATRTR